MSVDNYYNILGVAQDASAKDLQKAIAEKRREWTPRTSHPKLETRQLAEQTIKKIAEAETILLDVSKRRAYDQQLAAQVAVPEPAQTGPASGRDWLQIARDYLVQGNGSLANYAAREATEQQPENPEAWHLRGLSSYQLGNNADAEFELHEAVRLNPNDASYHAELGDLYKENEVWEKALPKYRRASQLEPGNVYYSAFVGISEGMLGNVDKACDILKAAHEKLPEDDMIRYFYGLVLVETVIRTWPIDRDNLRYIITEKQLNYSKEKLRIVDSLGISDAEFREELDGLRVTVERAELVKFWSFEGLGLLVVGEIATIIALLISSKINQGFVVLFLVLAILWVVLFVRSRRMPGWKWNWKNAPAYLRQAGLQ